jgi:hypothetical protein
MQEALISTLQLACRRHHERFVPNSHVLRRNEQRRGVDVYIPASVSNVGRDSLVDIAPSYGLDGPGIESRRGRDFSVPVQTCPVAHAAS